MVGITVNCKIPECEEYALSLNDQTILVDSQNSVAHFTVDTPGEYVLQFEQKCDKPVSKLLSLFIFVLTIPFRAIALFLLIATIDNEGFSWETHIKAFMLKGKVHICVNGETTVQLGIKEASFSRNTNTFKAPDLQVLPDMQVDKQCLPNEKDITHQYNIFMKRILAVVIIIGLFCLWRLIFGTNSCYSYVLLISLMAITAIVLALTWYYNRRKKIKLHKILTQQLQAQENW